MNWSGQQEAALKDIKGWLTDTTGRPIYRLFGYAGTGKTTLTKEIANMVGGDIAYGAFTGKAASVMRRKGCNGASTIHSMIYRPKHQDDGSVEFVLDDDSRVKDCAVVVIDECSMVGDTLGKDLMSFGKPVLVIGDPAQLPPIKGQGYFTEAKPDTMLTEVHRQAAENPIIKLSMLVRNGDQLQVGDYGETKVIERKSVDRAEIMKCDQVIVGLNKTRHTYNARMRVLREITSEMPVAGEKLICLKNDRKIGVFNGSMWQVKKCKQSKIIDELNISVLPLDEEGGVIPVKVKKNFFNGTESALEWQVKRGTQEFTFGYAITCHKSQGSQWDYCIVFDESSSFRDNRTSWLYTAITRAATKLTLVQ